MKYLIVKCSELGDQYECDADRTPVCLTDDYEKYDRYEYEIYEITSENTFKLIKEYGTSSNQGMAVYKWYDEEDYKGEPDEIMVMDKGYTREDYTKSKIKQIKSDYHFKDSVNDIYTDIKSSGSHGEEINGEWVVIGEYIEGDYWERGY